MPYQTRKPVIGEAETEGFDNYVRAHFLHAIEEAAAIIRESSSSLPTGYLVPVVLDKLTSHRVFLIDAWKNLSDDQRLSYYSKDYQDKAKREAEELSRKASEALSH
jgi:hypothetical protein